MPEKAKTNASKAKTTGNIHTKLLAFQQLNISVKKGSENPHFKSKFADINEILDKVKKPLTTLGVVIIQIPTSEGLKTILHDTESGTEVEGYLEFCQRGDAQKLGSNITYYRRYSLLAMLGLEDEDDDANKAVEPSKPQMSVEEACVKLRTATNLDELKVYFTALPTNIKKDNEVHAMKEELKKSLNF